MSYKIIIPNAIKQALVDCRLPHDLLIEVYNHLHGDLADDPEGRCYRLNHPVPTLVYHFTLRDEGTQILHSFTFWLTYGKQQGDLVVRYLDYRSLPPGT
jgi:hypothetical protein